MRDEEYWGGGVLKRNLPSAPSVTIFDLLNPTSLLSMFFLFLLFILEF